MSETRRKLFWGWAKARSFAILAYLLLWASSIMLYDQVGKESPAPYNYGALVQGLATVTGTVSFLLVVSAVAGAHAVIYGISNLSAFLVKLEIPSLRVLSTITILHSAFAFEAHRPITAILQLALGAMLLHEMRWLSVLRKGQRGRFV